MTPEERAAIKARSDAATPGPLTVVRGAAYKDAPGIFCVEACLYPPDTTATHGFQYGGPVAIVQDNGEANDADFFAHANTDIPALLAAVEERDKRIAELELRNERLCYIQSQVSPNSSENAILRGYIARLVEALPVIIDHERWVGMRDGWNTALGPEWDRFGNPNPNRQQIPECPVSTSQYKEALQSVAEVRKIAEEPHA